MKNHYQILEIPETASVEEISKAYRRLAVKYHPDKGSKTSEKFREITEAYEFLKDASNRTLLDKKLNSARRSPARLRRGTDVTITLKVNLNDIVGEVSRTIVTTRSILCPTCDGTGTTKKVLTTCPKCSGTGIDVVSAVVGPKKFCSLCRGYGNYTEESDCKKCGGTGLVKEKIQRTFNLDRENQEKIVIKESGNYPFGGGQPGDLIISLLCENKNLFEVSGNCVKGVLPISPAQAVLGDVIFIDVFNNPVKVTVPAGTDPGSIIEQSGIVLGSGKGKLILKVHVKIEKSPSQEEKNLYKQLLKLQKGLL
jgi:molecular chaperone DnaJ